MRASRAPPKIHRTLLAPEQRQRRVGEAARDVGEKLRPELTVDDPMIERQRELGDLPYRELAVDHPRGLPDGAEREDRRLSGVEDRCARVHAEAADVGD